MKFNYTKEQKIFFDEVKFGVTDILVEAFAGCAKTTTAIESLKYIPKEKTKIFLAFNKHIRDELKKKLPDDVKTQTLHGVGYGSIIRKHKNIEIDEFKIDKIINKKKNNWYLHNEFSSEEEINNYLQILKKIVGLCKVTLTTKKQYVPFLCERYGIKYSSDKDIKRVFNILEESMKDIKTIDYNDMVFLPAIDKKYFLIPYDYVYVDEIQDLNKAQQFMINKIVKRDRKTNKKIGRLILIGDQNQSIYSFSGVYDKTFDWYRELPNIKKLRLSTTFRCSKNIVKHAQQYVPNIKASDNAMEGVVREGSVLKEAKDGDFVLCRTTMPLVKLFFEFLLKERKVVIRGNDIGISLIDMIGESKTIIDLKNKWEKNLNEYKESLYNKGVINPNDDSGYTSLEDKVLTLLFISRLAKNIEDLKIKIKNIFSDEIEGIVLSTVHKSKGLEANRVFIVRPDLLPMKTVQKPWEVQQEKNLHYVAITRAKNELIYDNEWTDVN